MNYYCFSHCGGDKAISPLLRGEIEEVIKAVDVKIKKKAATTIVKAVVDGLIMRGWSGEVRVSQESNMTITSMKQDAGLCMQAGNMARMYADLMKLQTLYLDNAIKSAIYILPSKPVARAIGSNIVQADRLDRELKIFKKAYHVPTLIFALE